MTSASPAGAATAARQSMDILERLGAKGYIERNRRLFRELGTSLSSAHRARSSRETLSASELEVASLVAEGLTNAQIAKRVNLSWHTVEHHLERIYSRLGISSRAALTRYVIEAGLLPPAPGNAESSVS